MRHVPHDEAGTRLHVSSERYELCGMQDAGSQVCYSYLTLICHICGKSREVMASWLTDHKTSHSRILDMVHFQRQCPDCCSHHAVTVVDQLDCFSVQGKGAIAEEELHCIVVEFEADRLQEGNVVTQNLLVVKVKAHAHNLIYVVVTEQIEDSCFALYVLHTELRYQLFACKNDKLECLQE